jgi:hypothetical protein
MDIAGQTCTYKHCLSVLSLETINMATLYNFDIISRYQLWKFMPAEKMHSKKL